ncbi:MIP/aquaporin family protein [Rubrobacter aplysinae]|uniref:MIP/aquaporin family protein n=1 Tax=Rubrobacter aplysinae TaxID=909625 RepID=UPI00064BDB96|nr:MIP/aquaporin family protein [Rubrobacter aplysinae]
MDFSVYLAEFVGTLILVLLGDGVVAGVLLRYSKAEDAGWIVITFGWGLAVALAVYSVGWVSGAHINPAVTVGLASIGSFDWAMVPGYILAQMLGAFTGAVLVWLAYYDHWGATEDAGLKLGAFCTAPGIRNTVPNFITEVIGTAMLVFGVVAIGANATAIGSSGGVDLAAVFSTGIAPLLVGFLVLAIGLSLGGPTGYAINPARDLGPRIAHAVLPIAGKGGSDWGYSWIPVVAPIVGGVIGAVAYNILGF